MTPHQIELIVRRAATHGLDATGVAELERDLVLVTGTSEVLTGADNCVWSVPVALPAVLPPPRRHGESVWPTDDEILESARIAGVTAARLHDPEPYGVIS